MKNEKTTSQDASKDTAGAATDGTGKRKAAKAAAPNQGSSQSNSHPGTAGELHQTAGGTHPPLTTDQGLPISDNQNSLRANSRGPSLLEDFILREKITHFDHERIPERVVHARGTAVHGYFELTHSLAKYTTAKILTEVGEKTPLFTRISTVAGGAGSVDTPRDVRALQCIHGLRDLVLLIETGRDDVFHGNSPYR